MKTSWAIATTLLLAACRASGSSPGPKPATAPPPASQPAAGPDEPSSSHPPPDQPGAGQPGADQTTPDPSSAVAARQRLLDSLVGPAERPRVREAAASLELRIVELELWVTDGNRRAPLRRRATELNGVTRETGPEGEPVLVVDYTDGMRCTGGDERERLSARSLLSRLENASALRLHHEGEFVAASRGFAAAVSLDPSFPTASSNLACALALRGRPDLAVTALAPWLEQDLIPTYHTVMLDPELASLRERPALRALRAPTPGTARLHDLVMAYSRDLSMVAFVRAESSWGSCAFTEELILLSATTGERITTLPVIDWEDTEASCEAGDRVIRPKARIRVDRRRAAVDRVLTDMGFDPSPHLEVSTARHQTDDRGERFTARFPKAGLGIAVREGTARLLKKDEVLGVSPGLGDVRIRRAGYDPETKIAFVEWLRDVPEGCDDGRDGTGVRLVLTTPPTR